MIRVVFICHGNICRSPMAEFIFKYYVKKEGLEKNFEISSRACSDEELGREPNLNTKKMLSKLNIDVKNKVSEKIQNSDYDYYDYLICMDDLNYYYLQKIFNKTDISKVHKLLDYTDEKRDIADPWYTHDYEQAFRDISKGCLALLDYLKKGKM